MINGTGVTLYFCPAPTQPHRSQLDDAVVPDRLGRLRDLLRRHRVVHDRRGEHRLVGAIYAKSADLSLHNLSVEGDVVANTVTVHSGGVVTITSAPPPPPPSKGTPTLTTTASGPVDGRERDP